MSKPISTAPVKIWPISWNGCCAAVESLLAAWGQRA